MKKLERIHPPYLRLKAWLAENGIGLEVVAKILDTTVSAISHKNNGYSDYSVAELNKLAANLGLNLNVFKPNKAI